MKINPSTCIFSFRLSEYDCYKVRTGHCSLLLTEEEVQQHDQRKESEWREGAVYYCRKLAAHMEKEKWFDIDTGIRAEQKKCGHITFSSGQHRSCIAKKLKIQSLVLEELAYDNGTVCNSCYYKERYSNYPWYLKLKYTFSRDPYQREQLDNEF